MKAKILGLTWYDYADVNWPEYGGTWLRPTGNGGFYAIRLDVPDKKGEWEPVAVAVHIESAATIDEALDYIHEWGKQGIHGGDEFTHPDARIARARAARLLTGGDE